MSPDKFHQTILKKIPIIPQPTTNTFKKWPIPIHQTPPLKISIPRSSKYPARSCSRDHHPPTPPTSSKTFTNSRAHASCVLHRREAGGRPSRPVERCGPPPETGARPNSRRPPDAELPAAAAAARLIPISGSEIFCLQRREDQVVGARGLNYAWHIEDSGAGLGPSPNMQYYYSRALLPAEQFNRNTYDVYLSRQYAGLWMDLAV